MTTSSHCHMEGAVDSAVAYLNDGTTGLNTVLAEIRTESSLTTAQLPDVRQVVSDQLLVDRTPAVCVLATAFRGTTGGSAGRANSQGFRHGEVDVQILVFIRGADMTHDAARTQEATVQRAAYRYAAALHRMLTARGPVGQSLASGSGRGAGRIVSVFDIAQDLEVVVADAGMTEPNRVLVTTFTATTAEE